jgi:hypothetical protein
MVFASRKGFDQCCNRILPSGSLHSARSGYRFSVRDGKLFRLKRFQDFQGTRRKGRRVLKRPVEHPIEYLSVDASYFKVRTESRYVTKAFLIVTGIRDDGYREILGARIADGEDELFWSGLFQDLKDRGLSGVKLVISDGHKESRKMSRNRFWVLQANFAD